MLAVVETNERFRGAVFCLLLVRLDGQDDRKKLD